MNLGKLVRFLVIACLTSSGGLAYASAQAHFSEPVWTAWTRKAAASERQGVLADAESYYRQALLEAGKPGSDNEFGRESSYDLAVVFQKQGKLDGATRLLEHCLSVSENQYGPASQRLDPALDQLSKVYAQAGRLAEAERTLARLLEIRKRVLSSEDPKIVAALFALADYCRRQNRWQQAEVYSRQLVTARQQRGNQENLAATIELLAQTLTLEKKWAEADRQYHRLLEMHQNDKTTTPSRLVADFFGLGKCAMEQDKYDLAIQYFRNGLTLVEMQEQPKPGEELNLVAYIALCQMTAKQYPQAEITLKRRLAMELKSSGPRSRGTKRALELLMELYQKWNKPAEAERYSLRMRQI